jgi:hypothetical protein
MFTKRNIIGNDKGAHKNSNNSNTTLLLLRAKQNNTKNTEVARRR